MNEEVPVAKLHGLRNRAESFGAAAADYDRFRPGYPAELIDELVALRPRAVLDIGCGTGKAATLLQARGLHVLGVEIDAGMAALARGHGVPVEVASFEQWDDAGRTFDLVVSGQAWHWVDPAIGAPKVVRLLRPGGAACFFWNYEDLDEATDAAVDAVYRTLAPEAVEEPGGTDEPHLDVLRGTGCFTSIESKNYPRTEVLPIDEWIARISTYSKHLVLDVPRRAELQAALRAALAELAETVTLSAGTYAIWARP